MISALTVASLLVLTLGDATHTPPARVGDAPFASVRGAAIATATPSRLASSVGSTSLLVCLEPSQATTDETLRELYRGGQSFADFLADAVRRKELWHANYAKGESVDRALVERARAVGGTWRFLAVAVDSCSDSVSTIPYLARLVELVDGLDLRIIDSTAGREIMEAHRTADGRAATPTVLLLDSEFDEAGCFIERPIDLQKWIAEGGLTGDAVYENKMQWYADDAGQRTVLEFVTMLEAAAVGRTLCAR